MQKVFLTVIILFNISSYVFATHTLPRDAANLNRGLLPNNRLSPSSVTLQGNSLSISTMAAAINRIESSSDTQWIPMIGSPAPSSSPTWSGRQKFDVDEVRFYRGKSIMGTDGSPSSLLDIVNGSVTVRGTDAGIIIASTKVAVETGVLQRYSTGTLYNISGSSFNLGEIIVSSLTVLSDKNNPISIKRNTDGEVSVMFRDDSNSWVFGQAADGHFFIYDNTNFLTRFHINSNGNLGIGTQDEVSLLDVVGGSITTRGNASGLVVESGSTTMRGVLHRWPGADGSSGTALHTDGSGNIYFSGDESASNPTPFSECMTSIGSAASTNATYVGTSQAQWIAVSTTFLNAGKVCVAPGSYTFTGNGATIPWNQEWIAKGADIWINGNFNAFTVSGTLTGSCLKIPYNYNSVATLIKSSGTYQDFTVDGGSIASGTDFTLGYGVIRFETKAVNATARRFKIQNVDAVTNNAYVGIIGSSNPTYAIVDSFDIRNCFNKSPNAPLIQHNGGTWNVTNGWMDTRGRMVAYDGGSYGSSFKFNKFIQRGDPNNGSIGLVDYGSRGDIVNMDWSFNHFGSTNIYTNNISSISIQQFFLLDGDSVGQYIGGNISFNTFDTNASNAIAFNSDSIDGVNFHGNVLSSSATISDSGQRTHYNDNMTLYRGRYPNDSPSNP